MGFAYCFRLTFLDKMNLEAGNSKAAAVALPQFKKFVSEGEVEDAKRKRQEEWDRVRKPHQPVGEASFPHPHSLNY